MSQGHDRNLEAGRRMSRRTFLTGAAGAGMVVAAAPLLAACGGSSSAKGGSAAPGSTVKPTGSSNVTNKVLKMAQGSAPQTLDPDKLKAGTDSYIQENMFEFLLKRNTAGAIVPWLAASYTISPNGLQYTFHLRPNVTFHNGEPFNANAAKFSYERYIAPAIENVFAFQLAALTSVVAVDPMTIQLNLKSPIGNLIDELAFAPMVPPTYLGEKGDAYFGQHPVGTGPFSFGSYQIGQSWSLNRYDQYWGQKPGFAGLQTSIISEDASRLAALESGQVDFITQVNPVDAKNLSSRGFTVESAYSGTEFHLVFDMEEAGTPWQNQAVRQALNIAIDRDAIRQALFLGYSIDFSRGLTTYAAGYNDLTSPAPTFDPAKAKQMLASAGYPHGFSMDLVGPADGRFVNSAEVMQAIAGQWGDIGVKTNVQALAYNQWINTIFQTGSFHGAAFGDESGADGTASYDLYLGPAAYSHIRNDAHLNELVLAMINTSGAAHAQAVAAVAEYNAAQCYFLPLYGDKVIYGMKGVNWQPWNVDGFAYMGNAFPA